MLLPGSGERPWIVIRSSGGVVVRYSLSQRARALRSAGGSPFFQSPNIEA